MTTITIFFVLSFLATLTSPAICQLPPVEIDIPDEYLEKPNPPPGYIDLTTDAADQPPVVDIGNPNFYDASVYWLGQGQGDPSGAYVSFYPAAVQFETDWWTTTQEWWVQTTVVKTDEYKAEVGLDIKYQWHEYVGWFWTVDAFAGVSEDPDGYSYIIDWYHVSTSIYGPASATVGVYEKDIYGNWGWAVNSNEFATHLYPERWAGYKVHVCTEAYNQPVADSGGQTIATASSLYVKRASDGWWGTAIYWSSHGDNGVFNDWMVDVYAANGYRYDWSTRY